MVDILAFGAHPDDLEFGCGGILAKMAAMNKSIVMVAFTSGEKGSAGTPEGRQEECRAAAAVIGAEQVTLDFKDCEISDSYASRLKIVPLIRHYKPRLLLAPVWKGEQSHPDHIACGLIVRYGCRYARFKKILPHLPTHTPEGILHYPGGYGGEACDFLVDVTAHLDKWKAMIECHRSQLNNFDYASALMSVALRLGLMCGGGYAQGLVTGNPIIVDDIMAVAHMPREI